jgi:two-component system C4-dicarboxylate transport sensor histidine kinase DctB
VADRGHGLGQSSLLELQEPFVTSRESGQGMGLGLAISAGIVKEHHGVMTARNRDGGGAAFRVEIPLAETTEEAAE